MFLIRFLIFTVFTLSLAHASVQTETHTYIISPEENKIVSIDRKTGTQKVISVGKCPMSMCIHGRYGYVVNKESHTITILDLETQTVTETLNIAHPTFKKMPIYGNYGYLAQGITNSLLVLDLGTNKVVQTVPLGMPAYAMTIDGDKGYVVHTLSQKVSVINLKSNTVIQTIQVGSAPISIGVCGDRGYLVDGNDGTLAVLDLNANTVIQTIDLGKGSQAMVMHEDHAYVVNFFSHTLSVVDLKTDTVIRTISVGEYPGSIVIHEDKGYVKHAYSKEISVISLTTYELIETIKNPEGLTIDFSDTHIYLGVTKLKLLPAPGLCLFTYPYSGIEGFYDQDPEEALASFEEALAKKDYPKAKEYFEIAIAQGHIKAYSIACYAFTHGVWGARKDDTWANEFFRSLKGNFSYFLRLDHEEAYPYDFVLKAVSSTDIF